MLEVCVFSQVDELVQARRVDEQSLEEHEALACIQRVSTAGLHSGYRAFKGPNRPFKGPY